jgi:hypothetical protein
MRQRVEFTPERGLMLDTNLTTRMGSATRDRVEIAANVLAHGGKYAGLAYSGMEAEERRALHAYLTSRLAFFQNDTETLEDVERRDFAYEGEQTMTTAGPTDDTTIEYIELSDTTRVVIGAPVGDSVLTLLLTRRQARAVAKALLDARGITRFLKLRVTRTLIGAGEDEAPHWEIHVGPDE